MFWWRLAIGGVVLSAIVQRILPAGRSAIAGLLVPKGIAVTQTTGSIVIGVLFEIVDLVIWAALVYNVGRGSNGARWWLTVLASIANLVLLLGIFGYFLAPTIGNIVSGLVGIAVFVFVILAIVAMHKPGIRYYFERQR